MLTLQVVSDGSPGDLQQIVSLAFNTGMTVVADLPDGTTATATPTQVAEAAAAPAETPVEVDEPHPVLEKEVPADPPSVEPVAEPSTEAAPAETPAEVVESTP